MKVWIYRRKMPPKIYGLSFKKPMVHVIDKNYYRLYQIPENQVPDSHDSRNPNESVQWCKPDAFNIGTQHRFGEFGQEEYRAYELIELKEYQEMVSKLERLEMENSLLRNTNSLPVGE
jgi:hypothetical protein